MSGQAYGTPHQIAAMYGGNANTTSAMGDVPTGHNDLNPNEPVVLPGRPSEKQSIIGTANDPLGRDRTGRTGMRGDTGGEQGSIRPKYQGGSPLALENASTKLVYLQNKALLEGLGGRKVSLFEQNSSESLLDERNLRDDIE
jgi:hypothetical protein